ncbi:MAG: exosortase/archaeosortase family protein, partial [Opitutaceae bacterium]
MRFQLPGGYVVATALLCLAFAKPLWGLARFSLGSDIYSHVVLMPFVSLYLVWIKRRELPPASRSARGFAILFFAMGGIAVAGYWWANWQGAKLAPEDALALTTLGWLLLFAGVSAWFLGHEVLRSIRFPLAMLAFMIPFPVAVLNGIEFFLQHGSAQAALAMFRIVGTPLFQHGLVFELPGNFSMQVAPECSGIHSTLALLITSLLAGHIFLRSAWARTILTLAVVPLALVRNGFRVFTLGELCVHISPKMIDSYIHHHGGPIFFALSLVPFSILLL